MSLIKSSLKPRSLLLSLVGPAGSGKTTFAFKVASAIARYEGCQVGLISSERSAGFAKAFLKSEPNESSYTLNRVFNFQDSCNALNELILDKETGVIVIDSFTDIGNLAYQEAAEVINQGKKKAWSEHSAAKTATYNFLHKIYISGKHCICCSKQTSVITFDKGGDNAVALDNTIKEAYGYELQHQADIRIHLNSSRTQDGVFNIKGHLLKNRHTKDQLTDIDCTNEEGFMKYYQDVFADAPKIRAEAEFLKKSIENAETKEELIELYNATKNCYIVGAVEMFSKRKKEIELALKNKISPSIPKEETKNNNPTNQEPQ